MDGEKKQGKSIGLFKILTDPLGEKTVLLDWREEKIILEYNRFVMVLNR